MTTTAEGQHRATTPLRNALRALVLPGVLLALVYSAFGTWSIGQGFGGESDTGWVDFEGRPIDHAPPVVSVHGHPAAWVYLVLALLLVTTAVWLSRTTGPAAGRRGLIGVAIATAFIAAVILVFSVLQGHLVQTAFERGSTHPPILGNATVMEQPMTRTG